MKKLVLIIAVASTALSLIYFVLPYRIKEPIERFADNVFGDGKPYMHDKLVLGPPLHRYIGDYVGRNFNYLVNNQNVPLENIRFNSKETLHLLDENQISVFSDPYHYKENDTYFKQSLVQSKMTSLNDYMEDGKDAVWYFNAELAMPNAFPDGNNTDEDNKGMGDVIAYLPGMSEYYCKRFGGEIPTLKSDQENFYKTNMINDGKDDYRVPQKPVPYLDVDINGFIGDGCFQSYDEKEFVYVFLLHKR